MSVLTVRGGIPHVFRDTAIDAANGRYHAFQGTSNYLKFVTGLKAVKVYFRQADFDNDVNYIGPHTEWDGPVETNGVWLRCAEVAPATSEIELVAFIRRA